MRERRNETQVNILKSFQHCQELQKRGIQKLNFSEWKISKKWKTLSRRMKISTVCKNQSL